MRPGSESIGSNFETRGLVRLDGFLPPDRVAAARDKVLGTLERQGLRRDGGWCYDGLDLQDPRQGLNSKLVKSIKKSRVFRELMTDELVATIRDLAGGPVVPMLERPQLLFSLPDADAWSVPHNVWHVDTPPVCNAGLVGIQAFTFLDDVQPGGGGTVVVAGSHRMLDGVSSLGSKQVKRYLRREPYFRELMDRRAEDRGRFHREPTRVGDVDLQVVEMIGAPGDVYLSDMRLLHAPAPNATRAPRIMLTGRYLLEAAMGEFQELIDAARPPSG